MKKIINFIFAASLLPASFAASASVADDWDVPGPDARARVGASMPYLRYDSEEATLRGGAELVSSPSVAPGDIASQGSNRNYIKLPSSGAYAEWTISSEGVGDGVTMRFTMPDTGDGRGQNGSLDIYVNDVKVKTVDLTSFFMWQYFGFGSGSPMDTPGGDVAAFAFDETHFRLDRALKAGDRIRVQSSGANGLEYGVDFIEVEPVPAELEPDGDYVSILDYGAVADDGRDDTQAWLKALAAADNGCKVMYLPPGTYNFDNIVDVRAEGVKIMGAGIWYTNIKFNSEEKQKGGFSGGNGYGATGNPKIDGYCKNLEFCHMYINSGLRSRYGEQAVYKCFMDVWCDGTVIHDIWQEHFECGFWFGDYNGAADYSDGVKVINCRIRNNFADGVNFCQGTSNAYVYNCSIRNCGDDGLAVWNNNSAAPCNRDEYNDVFAYNTIDFVWRAGGIAIYGGDGHKIYNNYIRDMFMAAGIHVNDRYPGAKFTATKNITFDNNILVGCGTNRDCWNEDFGAVDIIGNVHNVTFNNTQIYDSPFDAIRVKSEGPAIVFNDTKILGSGLAGGEITWSCTHHSPAALRIDGGNATFNNLVMANVAPDKKPENGVENTTWPIWNDRNQEAAAKIPYEYLDDASYEVPGYPSPAGQSGGIVDPLEGVTGYDLVLTGLAWKNTKAENAQYLTGGDKVTFLASVKNASPVTIPAGVTMTLRVKIDGKTTLSFPGWKEGLAPNQEIVLSTRSPWEAITGGHTAVAELDYNNKYDHELSEDNNSRTKHFNVYEPEPDAQPELPSVTGSYDLAVVAVGYQDAQGNRDGEVNVGDAVTFYATIANIGDRTVGQGQKIGVQWTVDGKTYGNGHVWWCDSHKSGITPGETITLTPNGGNFGSDAQTGDVTEWIVKNGRIDLMAWVDDDNLHPNEVDEGGKLSTTSTSNNGMHKDLTFPKVLVELWENPDAPDPVDPSITTPDVPDVPDDPMAGVEGFNFELFGLRWDLASQAQQAAYTRSASVFDTDMTVNHGDELKFSVRIDNTSTVSIPEGARVRSRVRLDNGTTLNFPDITDGFSALSSRILTTQTSWKAVAGARTATAEVNYNNILKNEYSADDNTRVKRFNVIGSTDPEFTEQPRNYVTGGSDLRVIDILWQRKGIDATPGHGPIAAGDQIIWTAIVVNDGDQATTFGGNEVKCGVQFQIDGNTSNITWCDEYKRALQPHERVVMTANGGSSNGNNYWTATGSSFNITAWINDTHNVVNEVGSGSSDDANKYTLNIALPYKEPTIYHDENDLRDILVQGDITGIEEVAVSPEGTEPEDDVWYTAGGIRLAVKPTAPGLYIHNGRKVVIR